MLSSEIKFYDRKESSLTKYYRIISKLTVFYKFLTFFLKYMTQLTSIRNESNKQNYLSLLLPEKLLLYRDSKTYNTHTLFFLKTDENFELQ